MRIPRVSRGISALKNGKRRREGDRRGAEWGQAGRERVGEGAVVSERTMGGIYLHYDTGSTSSFFFSFFVSRCGNAESSSRFDPTRIVLVYENRSTNIERISLEISALRKSYVFFYVYVYVYVTRLASPRHAAKTLTFCTGVMIVSKRSSFVRNSLGYFVSVRFVAFEPFLCCALLPDRIY